MSRLVFVSVVFSSSVLITGAQDPRPDQQTGVFRAVGDSVQVFATVTDGKSGRLVTNLTRDQFTVRDEGKPQALTTFDNSPQPVRLIVLVDVSGSMAGNLPLLRAAGQELFARLLPADSAKVGTFGQQIDLMPSFTSDTRALVAALPGAIDPGAPTPLWKAVNKAMDGFGDEPGRRVILIASDGKDTPLGRLGEKYVGQPEVVDRALREDIMLYALAMQSRPASGGPSVFGGGSMMQQMTDRFPDPGFGKAADATGGGYVELRPRDNFGVSLAGVVDELHSQYLLGYRVPVADGKSHDIDVRVAARDMKVRARKSYVAPRPR